VVALERFKYGLRAEFAPLLANWMIEPLQSLDPAGTGILVPIPLHPVRERERGFNQSEKLAVEIAKVTGHAVATNLLRRHRQTTTQTRLTKEERARNVHGAFVATDTSLPKAPLILVDDVATTGATLIAAAGALMPKGPTDLMALTACRARLVI
jgi:ComF family protein